MDNESIGGMPLARLEYHFENWKRWMQHDSVTDGAPRKAAGCIGGGYSRTFDDMADASDVRCARIVDALVDSLSHSERAAISHHYLYAVWRLRNLEETLSMARFKVAKGLVSRGVY